MTFEKKFELFETELAKADYDSTHCSTAICNMSAELIERDTNKKLTEADFDKLVETIDHLAFDLVDTDCDIVKNTLVKYIDDNSLETFIDKLRSNQAELDKLFD